MLIGTETAEIVTQEDQAGKRQLDISRANGYNLGAWLAKKDWDQPKDLPIPGIAVMLVTSVHLV